LLGSTFHSTFKAPLESSESATFNVAPSSALGRVIHDAKAIIIDEVTQLHRWQWEALDRLLRDVMQDLRPFGGKIVTMSGDRQQGLPVIVGGSRAQIVDATLKRSELWRHVQTIELQENMRVLRHLDDNPELAERLDQWDKWLSKLGSGTIESVADGGYIQLPPENCIQSTMRMAAASIPGQGVVRHDHFQVARPAIG